MIRPTARASLFVASAIPISLLIAVADADLWPVAAAYAVGVLVVLGLDVLLSLPPSALGVELDVPGVLYIGSRDPLTVRITMLRGARAIPADVQVDVGELLMRPARPRVLLAPGQEVAATLVLTPLRRGLAKLERLWIRWQGPMGLVWRMASQELTYEIPVLPNIRAVRQAALRFFARDAPAGQKVQRQQGDGSDFESLREYVPGLDLRGVDWKHSARHRKLVCKEFQVERNHNVILAFDTGQLMSEPLEGVPKLDRAINAGLLLAYASLREGDRVGLFGFDAQVRHYSEPVGGVGNFHRIQHASSGLDYRHEEANFTLGLTHLSSRLNRRALIVLMTDFVDTVTAEMMVENMQRLAKRHLVMFVSFQDPALARFTGARPETMNDVAHAAVADGFVRDRAVVMERLDRLGVHCLDVSHMTVDSELINRYLAIKQRELI